MPITKYTSDQQKILNSFGSVENFSVNSFTFFNRKTGLKIENAISTDNLGNVKFKDKFTEVYLKDLIIKAKNITETTEDGEAYTLYFQDNYNNKKTLGEIYSTVFVKALQSMVHWFSERANKNLSDGMDVFIFEEIMNSLPKNDDTTISKTVYDVTQNTYWKNKWFDIPCIQVVTPSYVDGKYAIINAVVNMKVKAEKSLVTGFRIYDATTGLELSRIIHTSERSPGQFTTYTIPISYQGPLPDSNISLENEYKKLTLNDIQNIQYENGVDQGDNVFKNLDKYEVLPISRHVIKLQWITCDIGMELTNTGEMIGDFGRYFDSTAETNLDVTIYSNKIVAKDLVQLNGVIDTLTLEKKVTTYKHIFEGVFPSEESNYSISFSTNKNVNVKLIERTFNGFSIEWDKYVEGLKIDWQIVTTIDENGEEELSRLTENRSLNHYLFPDKKISIDFCAEITDEIVQRTGWIDPEIIPPPPPECIGCECCEVPDYNINFTLLGGSIEVPACDPYEDQVIYRLEDHYSYSPEFTYQACLTIGSTAPESCIVGLVTESTLLSFGYGEGGGAGSGAPSGSSELNPADLSAYLSQCVYVNSGESVYVVSIPQYNNVEDYYTQEQLESYSYETLYSTAFSLFETYRTFGSYTSEVTGGSIIIVPSERKDYTIFGKKGISLQTEYGKDVTLEGFRFNEIEFLDSMTKKEINKKFQLAKLEEDKKKFPAFLPVQDIKSKRILTNFSINNVFSNYLNEDKTLKVQFVSGKYKSMVITTDGFLGQLAFKHHFVIFDPAPVFDAETLDVSNRPKYPGYFPIVYNRTIEELLEYIYTTEYPSDDIPSFPNFIIRNVLVNGTLTDVVINGELYNPMYDYRNYFLLGSYNNSTLKSSTDEELYVATDVPDIDSRFQRGRYFSYAGKYYLIKLDTINDNNTYVSLWKNKKQLVKMSTVRFKQVTQAEFDFNASLSPLNTFAL